MASTIAEEKIFFDGKQSEIDLPFKISFFKDFFLRLLTNIGNGCANYKRPNHFFLFY